MGVKSPIFHGAKAKLYVNNQLVGIFTSCSWGSSYDVHTAHILGRHGVAQFTYTGHEAVRVNLTGFRVLGTGPYAIGAAPELKELMQHTGIQIRIIDRESDNDVVTVEDCYLTDFNTGVNARSISDVSMTLLGRTISDETTDGSEPANDTKITDGSPGNE